MPVPLTQIEYDPEAPDVLPVIEVVERMGMARRITLTSTDIDPLLPLCRDSLRHPGTDELNAQALNPLYTVLL